MTLLKDENKLLAGTSQWTSDLPTRLFYAKTCPDLSSIERVAQRLLICLPHSICSSGHRLVHTAVDATSSSHHRLVLYTRQSASKISLDETPFEILYHDDVVVIVNKPANFLSVDGVDYDISVFSILRAKYPSVRMVHRLDYETSGVLIAALTLEAAQHLNAQFRAQQIHKTYEALVEGTLLEPHGRIELYLEADPDHRVRQRITNRRDDIHDDEDKDDEDDNHDHIMLGRRGKPSVTEYEIIETGETYQRVKLIPITGRTHQLRVHMQSKGCPILGESLYAGIQSCTTPLEDRTHTIGFTGPRDRRLCLHAKMVRFRHPSTSDMMEISTQCPF